MIEACVMKGLNLVRRRTKAKRNMKKSCSARGRDFDALWLLLILELLTIFIFYLTPVNFCYCEISCTTVKEKNMVFLGDINTYGL